MITYFTEQDLVSFGAYILSKERKQAYLDKGIPEDKINELLDTINVLDLTSWVDYLNNHKKITDAGTSNQ